MDSNELNLLKVSLPGPLLRELNAGGTYSVTGSGVGSSLSTTCWERSVGRSGFGSDINENIPNCIHNPQTVRRQYHEPRVEQDCKPTHTSYLLLE